MFVGGGHKEGEHKDGRAQGQGETMTEAFNDIGTQGLESTMMGALVRWAQGRRGTWKGTQNNGMNKFLLYVRSCTAAPTNVQKLLNSNCFS